MIHRVALLSSLSSNFFWFLEAIKRLTLFAEVIEPPSAITETETTPELRITIFFGFVPDSLKKGPALRVHYAFQV